MKYAYIGAWFLQCCGVFQPDCRCKSSRSDNCIDLSHFDLYSSDTMC